MKVLCISLLLSLVIVFSGWILTKYFLEKEETVTFLGAAGAIMWGVPGFLILGFFRGAWQVIHLDP